MTEVLKIILADDHPLLRKGLKDIIEETGEYRVIAEAGDGEKALQMIEKLIPAIAIIDIDMPKLNGLEVAKMVMDKKIPVDIIVLTMYDKENIFNRAMDAGVMGFVIKDSASSEIIDALKCVSSGKYFISHSVASFLIKRSHYFNSGGEDILGISKLTSTERKVLKLISEDKATKEIAYELFISVRTVETHRTNMCKKLGLHGTNALLRFALEHQEVL